MTTASAGRSRGTFAADAGLLGLVFLLPWAGLWTLGAYPVNDDFLYARSVWYWLDEGRLRIVSLDGAPPVTAVAHLALGMLGCLLLGFSYDTLQLVAVSQAWLGAVALHATVREGGGRRAVPLVCGLALAVNPFYFGHGFTFMTDTPAVAWMAVALWAFARADRTEKWRWAVVGGLAALVAGWTRQTGWGILAVPLLLGARRLLEPGQRGVGVRFLFAALAGPLLGIAVEASGCFIPDSATTGYPGVVRAFDARWAYRCLIDVYGALLIVGLSCLPLLPVALRSLWHRLPTLLGWRRGGVVAVGVAVSAGMLLPLVRSGGQTYLTNATGYFLQNAHHGPILLSDAYDPGRWGDMGGVSWPVWIWQAITLLAIGSLAGMAMSVLAESLAGERGPESRLANACLLTALVCLAGLLVAVEVRFDRYWMTLLVPVLAGVGLRLKGSSWSTPSAASTVAILALLYAGSVVFTHDDRAWNQARWSVVDHFRSEGFAADQIDGGYEVNGWHRSAVDPSTRLDPDPKFRWWSEHARRFLAVESRPGYNITHRQPWRSWATGRWHQVLGLRTSDANDGEPAHR